LPALFAYLIAVGLLLGGGYGALSWLAAPEPVKVAVKVKPRPPRHDEAGLQVTSQRSAVASASDAGSSSPGNRDQGASAGLTDQTAADPNGQSSSRQSGPGMAAMEAEVSEPARDQQSRSADAEASLPDARQKVGQLAPAASPVLSSNPTTATAAVATKAVKRSHLRQAGSHSEKLAEKFAEKRALVAMTLRTIEFADGRRVTRLIPYRSPERALAFEPDE
jgi:hypothetical protein